MNTLAILLGVYLLIGFVFVTIPTIVTYLSDREAVFGTVFLATLGIVFWPIVLIAAYKATRKLTDAEGLVVSTREFGDYTIDVKAKLNLTTKLKYYETHVTDPDGETRRIGVNPDIDQAKLTGVAYAAMALLRDQGYEGDIDITAEYVN